MSPPIHCQRERCLRFGGCVCRCPACAQVRTLEVLAILPGAPRVRLNARAMLERAGIRKAEPSAEQVELFASPPQQMKSGQ